MDGKERQHIAEFFNGLDDQLLCEQYLHAREDLEPGAYFLLEEALKGRGLMEKAEELKRRMEKAASFHQLDKTLDQLKAEADKKEEAKEKAEEQEDAAVARDGQIFNLDTPTATRELAAARQQQDFQGKVMFFVLGMFLFMLGAGFGLSLFQLHRYGLFAFAILFGIALAMAAGGLLLIYRSFRPLPAS
jgi:hypothetical protein